MAVTPQNLMTEDTFKTRGTDSGLEEYSLEGSSLEYTAAEMAAGPASDRVMQFVQLRARWQTLFTIQPVREIQDWDVSFGDLWELVA
jgi:hypothetical protein